MRLFRRRWFILLATVLLVGVPSAWVLTRREVSGGGAVVAPVKKGEFKVIVTTTGELRALKDVRITGPMNAQQAQIYQLKISTLIPEGTVVKEGDVVAELDRAPAATKLTEVSLALQKAQAQYEQAQLDSTLNLSTAREEMKTMELSLEEKRIAKEQAVYEAPSIQRQAEIDLERAQRALDQAKVDYGTKTEQAKAKMREVGADYDRQKNLLATVQDVMANFTIKAPGPGMVIYIREWNGKKRTAGAQIGSWDPAVATLPDLSQMESITYINEIDVRKVAVGQPAVVTLDADPSKRLVGTVTQVANVGEQRPNADAKVFEVHVTISHPDTTLRPGMTTGNAIETYSVKDALSVPLEAVVTEEGVPFVYRTQGSGVVKQEVETGIMNDDAVIITSGLSESDHVLLSLPSSASGIETVRLPGSGKTPKPTVGGDTGADRRAVPPSDSGTKGDAPKPAPAAPKTPPPAVRPG